MYEIRVTIKTPSGSEHIYIGKGNSLAEARENANTQISFDGRILHNVRSSATAMITHTAEYVHGFVARIHRSGWFLNYQLITEPEQE